MNDNCEIHDIESLHYYGDGHDKVWVGAILKHESGRYSYMAAWGRRGAALQSLHRDPTSLNNASSEFSSKVYEKLNKGYQKVPLDSFGIRSSIQTLISAFSSKANPISFWRRPESLTTEPLPFTPQNMETAIQGNSMGMIQDVILSGIRKMVEIVPGGEVTAKDKNGICTDTPKQLDLLKDKLPNQVLIDGCETPDGKFAILDCYEIGNSPIGWLPYTARLGLLEKELIGAGVTVPYGYMTNSIPDGHFGILSATNDTTSKLDLISNLPKLNTKTVLLRDSMSKVLPGCVFTQFELSAFA